MKQLTREEYERVNAIVRKSRVLFCEHAYRNEGGGQGGVPDEVGVVCSSQRFAVKVYHALRAAGYVVRLEPTDTDHMGNRTTTVVLEELQWPEWEEDVFQR